MSDPWRLRSYDPADYEAVIALWESCALPVRPQGRDARDHLNREIAERTAFLLEAWDGGTLVGTVLGTHDGRKGWSSATSATTTVRSCT